MKTSENKLRSENRQALKRSDHQPLPPKFPSFDFRKLTGWRRCVYRWSRFGFKQVRGLVRLLPPKSPNLNAHVERFIRTIKDEALNHVLIFGEGHLRRMVAEFIEHYHKLILRKEPAVSGRVVCHRRLGGLLKFYDRKAA